MASQPFVITPAHRLAGATWRPSEHHDARPIGVDPDLIVVHCVSLPEGQYGTGYPRALFCGELDCGAHESFADLHGMRVAPHLLIDRDGDVDQFVAFNRRAWHAGASAWRGRAGCNDHSIGIELEGDVESAYAPEQYERLAEIVVALMGRYQSLSVDGLVGHSEIAPGRKTDPGPYFDWPVLYRRVFERLGRTQYDN